MVVVLFTYVQGYGFFACGDSLLMGMLDMATKRTWPSVDPWSGPGQSEVLTPPLFLEYTVHSAHGFHRSHFKDTALSEIYVVETIWMIYVTDIFKNLVGRCRDLSIQLVATQTSLILPVPSPVPCLLNLTPTYLKWSASFLGLSLSSMQGAYF